MLRVTGRKIQGCCADLKVRIRGTLPLLKYLFWKQLNMGSFPWFPYTFDDDTESPAGLGDPSLQLLQFCVQLFP